MARPAPSGIAEMACVCTTPAEGSTRRQHQADTRLQLSGRFHWLIDELNELVAAAGELALADSGGRLDLG